jgi:hypothetical protein
MCFLDGGFLKRESKKNEQSEGAEKNSRERKPRGLGLD